ncbi:hypothetical protein BDN72DRAFT_410328 [Pluteus cervinus]|uniref:Uncharacterized protein n=1 Tax=Pluteus cervinus TaxID=181527 RepID=A0ACD3B1E7_9AGAR|nr:hypothetical protein BDN72DRAFT_410328 [Pluteus cervinus]
MEVDSEQVDIVHDVEVVDSIIIGFTALEQHPSCRRPSSASSTRTSSHHLPCSSCSSSSSSSSSLSSFSSTPSTPSLSISESTSPVSSSPSTSFPDTETYAPLSDVDPSPNPDPPITNLPPELLSQIFLYSQRPLNDIHQHQPPLTLTHTHNRLHGQHHHQTQNHTTLIQTLSAVCTQWRNVVIHSPLLWTTINISPFYEFEMVRIHLDRSGVCPVDLVVMVPPVEGDDDIDDSVVDVEEEEDQEGDSSEDGNEGVGEVVGGDANGDTDGLGRSGTRVGGSDHTGSSHLQLRERESSSRKISRFLHNKTEICGLISSCLPRCRSIKISGTFYNAGPLLDSILQLFEGVDVPTLQSFSLEGDSFDESRDPRICRRLFSGRPDGALAHDGIPTHDGDVPARNAHYGAPELREVRLGGFGILHCSLPPTTSLKTLHLAAGISVLNYTVFKSILEMCPELMTLLVYDDLVYHWPAGLGVGGTGGNGGGLAGTGVGGGQGEIYLPSLRSLQIYGNMRSVSQLLMSVYAPELEDLVIAPVVMDDLTRLEGRMRGTGEGVGGVRVGGQECFPKLKMLTLAPAHAAAFKALNLAATCFPSIMTLVLSNVYIKPFVDTFTSTGATEGDDLRGVIWPNLEVLGMRDMGKSSTEEAICEVVKWRKERGVGLKEVWVDVDSGSVDGDEKGKGVGGMKKKAWLEGEGGVKVRVRDEWNVKRRFAMYSDEEDRFVGTSLDVDSE